MWAVIGLDTEMPWTREEFKTTFEGHEIILRPQDKDTSPSVAMEYDGKVTKEEAFGILRRFLSSLSWVYRSGIREDITIAGSRPFRTGRSGSIRFLADRFSLDYVPETSDERARLALALYREATSLLNVPYQFLSYFKIINIIHSQGEDQKKFINDNLHKVESVNENKARIDEIINEHGDVGEYLYKLGRCAIAHAYQEPLIDPDKIDDTSRLGKDIGLVRSFAELIIEEILGIKSRGSYLREHLYFLEGFKSLMDEEVVGRLINREKVSSEERGGPQKLDSRVR